jgi:hypothetical protein
MSPTLAWMHFPSSHCHASLHLSHLPPRLPILPSMPHATATRLSSIRYRSRDIPNSTRSPLDFPIPPLTLHHAIAPHHHQWDASLHLLSRHSSHPPRRCLVRIHEAGGLKVPPIALRDVLNVCIIGYFWVASFVLIIGWVDCVAGFASDGFQ